MKFFRKHRVVLTRILCGILAASMILPMLIAYI